MSEFYGFLLMLWFVTGIWLCLEYIFDRNAPGRETWSDMLLTLFIFFFFAPIVVIAAIMYKRGDM
jgi:RsiW-degrading membrane proteinase PrsW (M82 family)